MRRLRAAVPAVFLLALEGHGSAQDRSAEPVRWLDSLEGGLALAKAEDKPLFVTLRCLPCKQCADFDRDVLEGGPALEPLLARFVRVRITDIGRIDLRLLPLLDLQDFDLSWWGFFLSPDAEVYGVFGGRDEKSDASRISVAALAATLERVLAHHVDPTRERARRPLPAAFGAKTVRELPGFASWRKTAHLDEQTKAADCIHCHQVAEILRQPALDAGTFDKLRDHEIWPLPENVGLSVDRDHGLRVVAVVADGPAARAGIAPGDELVRANDRRLFGQADLRAALHHASRDATRIELVVRRGGQERTATLALASGWKRTVLDWRMSVSQGNAGADPGFWPLPAQGGDRKRLAVAAGTMLIRPWFGPRTDDPCYRAGLRPDHAIVAVDGESPDLVGRAFLVWFRLRKDPGDEVELSVRDGVERRTIRYRLHER